jgi:hypothetical protein
MCSQDDWRSEDGLFDKVAFFDHMIYLFHDDPALMWCTETLTWWNKYVLPLAFTCLVRSNFYDNRRVFKPAVTEVVLDPQSTAPSDMAILIA